MIQISEMDLVIGGATESLTAAAIGEEAEAAEAKAAEAEAAAAAAAAAEAEVVKAAAERRQQR